MNERDMPKVQNICRRNPECNLISWATKYGVTFIRIPSFVKFLLLKNARM